MLKVTFSTLGIVAGFSVHADAQEDQAKSRGSSMTVSGVSIGELVPDVAVLRFGISVERATVSAATEEMARRAQAVIAEIKSQGLDPRDLKTSITLTPVYDEQRSAQEQSIKRTLRGCTARNNLIVRLGDTAQAGALARSLIDRARIHSKSSNSL